MEWVETTGRTTEDAKEAALDELGVDESDAEFEVIEEARAGLFGRLRNEARVRARVRPTAPRAKEDRRDRRRRNRAAGDGHNPADSPNGTEPTSDAESGQPGAEASAATVAAGRRTATTGASAGTGAGLGAGTDEGGGAPTGPGGRGGDGSGRAAPRRRGGRGSAGESRPARSVGARGAPAAAGQEEGNDNEAREGANVDVALEEQGRIAEEFLTELIDQFGLQASIAVVRPDEDTVDLQLAGADLGLLIGPKGSTLLAIQDLTRTVVHHQTGAGNGRIHVDVGGYRQMRTEALARFAQQVALTVQQSGTRTVLEPMTAADRKVVHDAITGIEGVATVSEGEEPQRRVVVVPAEH